MKKIYLISPNKLDKKFFNYLPKVLATKKVKYLQIRCKNLPKKVLISKVKKIIPITKKYKTNLIINDHADIGYYFKCGFHLGQNDLNKKLNKKFLKKKNFFGITCHNSLSLAKKALFFKPDYIAFGAFYETKTKVVKFVAQPTLIKKAKKKFAIPIVAIGGINATNYKILLKMGANYIAVSGFVWENKILSPVEAIKKFK